MTILPNEIHEDASPLDSTSVVEGGPSAFFSSLAGKNVFVNFKDRTFAVGMLHGITLANNEFQVGNTNKYFDFANIESFREV